MSTDDTNSPLSSCGYDYVKGTRQRVELGRGMTGVTYLGWVDKPGAGRVAAALKEVAPGIDGRGYSVVREVILTTRISARRHPCLVRFLDLFTETDGTHTIATEFVEGQNLFERTAALVAAGTLLAPDTVVRHLEIGCYLADALATVHADGVVHRDLKPYNILVRRDNSLPVLIDFGIGRTDTVREGENPLVARTVSEGRGIMGTEPFASPEQYGNVAQPGRRTTSASDVYSLGMVLWYLFAGQMSYRSDAEQGNLLRAKLAGRPDPASLPLPSLGPVLRRLLDPDPARRPTAANFHLELLAILGAVDARRARQVAETLRQPAPPPPPLAGVPAGALVLPEFHRLGRGREIAGQLLSVNEAAFWHPDASAPRHLDLQDAGGAPARMDYLAAMEIIRAINRDASERGEGWVYRLPGKLEWMEAAGLRPDGGPARPGASQRLLDDAGTFLEWCDVTHTAPGASNTRLACILDAAAHIGTCYVRNKLWPSGTVRLVRAPAITLHPATP